MLFMPLNTIGLMNFLTISFNGQLFFQKASTEIMQCIISLHNDIMFLIIVILFFVLWVLWRIIYFYNAKRSSTYLFFNTYLTIKKYYDVFWIYINSKLHIKLSNLTWLKPNKKSKRPCLSTYGREQKIDSIEKYFIVNHNDKFRTTLKHLVQKDNIRLNFTHHTLLEQIWTLIPTFILFGILLPSMTLIYMMDNVFDNSPERSALITLKIIGNQWYWTYQTSNGCLTEPITFDSYLDNSISTGYPGFDSRPLRLLQVDKEVYLPINTKIRLLITSNDVIHSWAIPSCGIKMDAVPGRINSTGLEIINFGRKIGQCSELCGTGHAFMPILIRVVPLSEFLSMLVNDYFLFCL